MHKPSDWPSNPYSDDLDKLKQRKKGGLLKTFVDSFKSAASGSSNNALSLMLNKKIVDMRDNQIINYLVRRKSSGVDLNSLF